MHLHVSSTCAQHEEVKIALHSLWYHLTYRCAQNLFYNKFYFMNLHVSSTCAHYQEVKLHYTASEIITPYNKMRFLISLLQGQCGNVIKYIVSL